MKTIFLFAIILLLNIQSNAQTLRIGIAGNFLVGNKYYNYQFGPALLADYSLKDVPFSIQGVVRYYLSELSNENNFSTGYINNVFSIGTSINYFPLKWDIEPYIGAGIFFNSYDMKKSGTGGNIRSPQNIKNNFSIEITGGVKLAAQSPLNFVAEVTQTFNKPDYELVIRDPLTRIVQKEHFNFNSLFIKLGLQFKI